MGRHRQGECPRLQPPPPLGACAHPYTEGAHVGIRQVVSQWQWQSAAWQRKNKPWDRKRVSENNQKISSLGYDSTLFSYLARTHQHPNLIDTKGERKSPSVRGCHEKTEWRRWRWGRLPLFPKSCSEADGL